MAAENLMEKLPGTGGTDKLLAQPGSLLTFLSQFTLVFAAGIVI
jgi:hypothetical protein